jgi:uncharacterized repeat protein (TIGR01451 family)
MKPKNPHKTEHGQQTAFPATATGGAIMKTANPALRATTTSVLALILALGASAPAYAAISNTAQVTASTPSGGTVSDTASEDVTVEAANPVFTVAKSVSSVSTASGADAANPDGGDVITYGYAVANTGNITLDPTTVSITDPGPTFDSNAATNSLSAISAVETVPGTNDGDANSNGVIDPGETFLYQATYTLAQADVDNSAGVASGVSNTITAAAADTSGAAPATFDSGNSTLTATYTMPENAVVTLAKIATRDGSTEDDGTTTAYAAGDDIIYLFTVANAGNVTLSSLTVSETAFTAPSGSGAPAITCSISGDATIASLAPGANETCTATYTVLEADM